jgi:hypothetical protein
MIKDSEVLDLALTKIAEPDLWCRRYFTQDLPGGRLAHCGEGAIQNAVAELQRQRGGRWSSAEYVIRKNRVIKRVVEELREIYPIELTGLWRNQARIAPYNDHPGMDQPTLHAAFVKALNRALEQGD